LSMLLAVVVAAARRTSCTVFNPPVGSSRGMDEAGAAGPSGGA
jgi:hypothetical protein